MLTPEYAGVSEHTGGIGRHFAALAPALADLGHEVHVVTLNGGTTPIPQPEGVRVHCVDSQPERQRLWYLRNDVQRSVSFDRVCRALGPWDVVFAPEWGGVAATYSLHRRSGPLVTNLATSLEQIELITGADPGLPRRHVTARRIQSRLERLQTKRSDGLLACSRAILGWTRELWRISDQRGIAIPNCIDVAATRDLVDGPLPEGFPSSGPVVLFFGRLEVRKGVKVLARAMHAVWDRVPDANLVLIGGDSSHDGESTREWMLRAAGDRVAQVHALGPQPPERLFPAVARADVVTLPSLWENFSIAGLEAKAVGAALVVTTGCGFDDFFVDGSDALMVPPSDEGALAGALLTLLDDNELRARLRSEAARDADCFTTAAVAPRVAGYFADVAASAG